MVNSIRRSFFIILISTFTLGLSAQVKIGVLGGLNSSSLFGDAPESAKYKSAMGIYTGIQLDFYVHKNVAISIQPSYSSEGAKLFYNVQGNPELVDSGKIGINYVRIPLLAKINFNNDRFYALAGFDVGMLMDAAVNLNNQEEEDISEPLENIDYSFHTGVGYRWNLKTITLFLEARYTVGIKNISDDVENNRSYAPRVKNSGLKLLFGVEIPLWNPKG